MFSLERRKTKPQRDSLNSKECKAKWYSWTRTKMKIYIA